MREPGPMVPELDNLSTAVEILQYALARLTKERLGQAEYLSELRDQVGITEALLSEATIAEAAVRRLLDGELYGKAVQAEPGRKATVEPVAAVDTIDWSEVHRPWSDLSWQSALRARWPAEVKAPIRVIETTQALAPVGPVATTEVSAKPGHDERALFRALKEMAGDFTAVTASLSVLSEASGIPKGSMLFVVRRLADAGVIEIIPNLRVQGAKKPNTYRILADLAPADEPSAGKPAAPVPPPPASVPAIAPAPTPVASAPAVEKTSPAPAQPPRPSPTPAERLLGYLKSAADINDRVRVTEADLCLVAGLNDIQLQSARGALVANGLLKVVDIGVRPGPMVLRVLDGAASTSVIKAPLAPQPPRQREEWIAPTKAASDPMVAKTLPEARKAPPAPREDKAEHFIPDELERDYTGTCSLMNLQRRSCHWPVGEPKPIQMYCAKPSVDGEEYCREHGAAKFASVGAAARHLDPRLADQRAEAARARRAN